MSRRENIRDFDLVTIFLYLSLVVIGWMMIYAVDFDPEHPSMFDMSKSYGRQFLWIGISIGIGLLAFIVESKFYRVFAYGFYGIAMLALLAVLFTTPVNGASSWFNLGFFKLQPSEFGKFASCLALAAFLGSYNASLQNFEMQLKSLGILFLPIALILWQPDAGSAIVYSSLLLVLFRAGMPAVYYILGIIVATLSIVSLIFEPIPLILVLLIMGIVIFILSFKINVRTIIISLATVIIAFVAYQTEQIVPILAITSIGFLGLSIAHWKKKWQLSILLTIGIAAASIYTFSANFIFNNYLPSHQKERVWVWLRPELCDPQGPLYNVSWAKTTIGAGGLIGKGFKAGELTRLGFVPEQSTDFIFCTVGEEQGFIGCVVLIILFTFLMLRVVLIAERQRSSFSRYYAYGVASIFFVHVFVNIGMTMGLVPVIGIPLPFISYGGSSLISFTILLAILLRLDSNRLLVFR